MCFRFSEWFCFCSTDYAVNFFTKSHCHSFLFCRERVILVSYFGLPLSYNQNTEQDTLPCSKVSSKNKQKISLHSFSFFFFVATSNQAQQISNSRGANLDTKRRSHSVFHWALWGKRKVALIHLRPRYYQLQFKISSHTTEVIFFNLSNSALYSYTSCLQLSLFLAAFGLISQTIQPVFTFKTVSTWKLN